MSPAILRFRARSIRGVIYFVSLYLVLSLPPFLFLNRDLLGALTPIVIVASLGAVALVALAGLLLASEGVDRYTLFLQNPMDVPSIFVDAFFLHAAVSWWLIPELGRFLGLELRLAPLLLAILACHVPMVLFLSLMTSIGKAYDY